MAATTFLLSVISGPSRHLITDVVADVLGNGVTALLAVLLVPVAVVAANIVDGKTRRGDAVRMVSYFSIATAFFIAFAVFYEIGQKDMPDQRAYDIIYGAGGIGTGILMLGLLLVFVLTDKEPGKLETK